MIERMPGGPEVDEKIAKAREAAELPEAEAPVVQRRQDSVREVVTPVRAPKATPETPMIEIPNVSTPVSGAREVPEDVLVSKTRDVGVAKGFFSGINAGFGAVKDWARGRYYWLKGPRHVREFDQEIKAGTAVTKVIEEFKVPNQEKLGVASKRLQAEIQRELLSPGRAVNLHLDGKSNKEVNRFYGGVLYRSLQELRKQKIEQIDAAIKQLHEQPGAANVSELRMAEEKKNEIIKKVRVIRELLEEQAPERLALEHELSDRFNKLLSTFEPGNIRDQDTVRAFISGYKRLRERYGNKPGMSRWYAQEILRDDLTNAISAETDDVKKALLTSIRTVL